MNNRPIKAMTVEFLDGTTERIEVGEDCAGYVATHTVSKLNDPHYQQATIAHITLPKRKKITA